MLLVVGRLPSDPSGRPAAAAAVGLALPDFVRKLTGVLPRIVLSSADAASVARAAEALRGLGYGALTIDPASVPGDGRRLVARTLGWGADALVATDHLAQAHPIPWSSLVLAQRAVRARSTVEVTTETRKEISLSRSVMSGGLINRKTVEEKHTTRTESREHLLVLHRGDGQPDVVLTEHRLDFRFLGAEKQVVGFANLDRTLAWVRRQLPGLKVEDRLMKPGFLAGLGAWPGDTTDLGLEVVRRCVVDGALE